VAGADRPARGDAADRGQIDQLRRTRVLVVHPPDPDGEVLVRQLRRIGCPVRSLWPPPSKLPDDIDAVFLLVERAGSDAPDGGPALIAVVEYENPTLLRGLLDSGAQAVVNKPIRATGLLSTLVLACALAAYDRRMQTKVRKLEDQLRTRRDVERATRLLMQLKGLNEADAYELMRGQATRSRLSIGEVAARILGASDVLGGMGLLGGVA
jgi:AmiR/NasT family two-component response regulator